MSMEEAASALARKEMDFREFEAKTGKLWSWWARRLVRDIPPFIDDDDVRQELLIEAWRSSNRWMKTGGAAPSTWIAQSALRAGRKAIMRARGVNRHTWRMDDPSRYDMATEDLEKMVDAEQENALLEVEIIREVESEHGSLAAIVVQAMMISEGDPEVAAKRIYDDPISRLLFRVTDEEQIAQVVAKTIQRIAKSRGCKKP